MSPAWWFRFLVGLCQCLLIVAKFVWLTDLSWWLVISPLLLSFIVSFSIGFANGYSKARGNK